MSKLKSIMKYLKKEDNKLIYTGAKEMIVSIPTFFEDRNFLTMDHEKDCLVFLGICKIEIGDESNVLIFPAMIGSKPDTIEIDKNKELFYLKYKKGDIFINETFIIRNSIDLSSIFMTFAVLGKKIPYLSYEDLPIIMDNMVVLSGVNLRSRRACYELLFGELARSKKDLKLRYRNTDMKGDYQLVSMRNIVYGPKSVSAKILGNYFNDGLVSSLLVDDTTAKKSSVIETYLKT